MSTRSGAPFETILLAEDHEAVREFLANILHGQGYTVLDADRGTHALRLWERHEGPIHLLLTDIRMPEMDGMELAHRVRAKQPTIPVLFMSAEPAPAALSTLARESKTAFLLKPFTPEVLTRTVQQLLALGE
jgi:two-component system, cell cycle sensor histidine kinase and response regulator CckA